MFLYPDGEFDPEDPSKGLFEGPILVRVGPAFEHAQPSLTSRLQAFKAIFISPTSTDALGDEPQDSGSSKKHSRGDRRTRSNIANLIGMNIVQPRAIAYVACQVRG